MMRQGESETISNGTSRNSSKIKYPLNILLLVVEKGIAKDMDKSLAVLKTILNG